MSKKKKRAVIRTPGAIEPPLVTFAETFRRIRPDFEGLGTREDGNMVENFRAFARTEAVDLSQRGVGNWDDLAELYRNVTGADLKVVVDELQEIGGNPLESARANAAGVNLLTAKQLMTSAILLHLHPERWNDRCGSILVRTALECVGRAVVIARGVGDEVHRWESGHEFRASECIAALETELAKINSNGPSAKRVYSWLCNFAHMNFKGVDHFYQAPQGGHEDAYAAMAYASWALAAVAEVILGAPNGATYPRRLPAKLPWD